MKYNYDFGTQFETKFNGTCTLIKYVNAKEVYVMFEDGTVVKVKSGNLLSGEVSNPNQPSVFGVGINDATDIICYSDKRYTLWHSIIRRAYSEVYHKSKPTYKEVEVCDRWKRFSNFSEDIVKLPFYEKCVTDGYELDKDILGGNLKVYSKETCCFVPREINAFFGKKKIKNGLPTGVTFNKRLRKYVACLGTDVGESSHLGVFNTVDEAKVCYDFNKKIELSRIANKWKGKIADNVYDALMKWEIGV